MPQPLTTNNQPLTTWSHGGIPVCFPWFGTNGPAASPLHGLVRSREWKVVSVTDASAVLEMESDPAMSKWFAGRFRLRLEVTLAASLDLRLTVENTGTEPFAYTNGFHPYFRVGDCTKATVDGVDGCRYWHGPGFGAMPWKGPVTFGERRDHVFWLGGHRQALNDPVLGRRIVVESSGNSRLVVWNPGPDGSPGLPADDWRRFVCVEPATIPAADGFTIRPGERQAFGMTISAERN